MKKLISCLVLVMACGCLLCGCGNLDSHGEISSHFAKLEEWNSASGLCYDRDTKIIYIYSLSGSFNSLGCYSYTPYYVMNTDNEPVVAVFNGDDFYECE